MKTAQYCEHEKGYCRHRCQLGRCQERAKANLLNMLTVTRNDMTYRNMDVHCRKCGKYMHSVMPEEYKGKELCANCGKVSPPTTLNSLLDGGWIERYHIKGQRMLTRQSVAEHSWRIIAIIFAVNSKPSAELVLGAAFHDVSERVTGDIPANVKRANPEIARVINEVSTAEEQRLGIRFGLTDDEERLLGWADRYEGALHCWDEYEMGNRKIVPTLRRYQEYYNDAKYKLANPEWEKARQELTDCLNQQIERIDL